MIRVLRMTKLEGMDKAKAFVDLEVNDLKIRGFKIVDNGHGLFVAYPQEKGKDNKYYDVVYPVTQDLETIIKETVLNYYLSH